MLRSGAWSSLLSTRTTIGSLEINKLSNKNFVDPKTANFVEEKELILEHINLQYDLSQYALLGDSEMDQELTEEFLTHNKVERYGQVGVENSETLGYGTIVKSKDEIADFEMHNWLPIVRKFRDELYARLDPINHPGKAPC